MPEYEIETVWSRTGAFWDESGAIDYRNQPALSSTGLKHFLDSPGHYKAYKDEAFIETDAMREGQGTHTLILEGIDAFNDRFKILSGRRTPKQKEIASDEGKTILTATQADNIWKWAAAVRKNETAMKLIGMEGSVEVGGFWPETTDIAMEGHPVPVRCKLKPDKRIPQLRTLVDLKFISTAKRNDPHLTTAFSASIANFGYHYQAAFYLRGASVIDGADYTQWVWIVVEKEPPHQVGCYLATPDMLDEANRAIEALLPRYAACLESNLWPAPEYDGIIPIYFRKWHRPIIE